MRVLQVHTRYREPGGEDVVVASDARLLEEAGHEVVRHDAANAEGARAAVDLLTAPWNVRAAAAVRDAVRRTGPDIVHVHNTWFALGPAPVRAVAALGVPIVATLHNYRMVCAPGTLFRDGRTCEDCVGTHPWHAVQHRCYRSSAAASTAAALTISTHRRARTWDRVSEFLALTEFAKGVFVAGGVPAERITVRSNAAVDPGPRPAPPSMSRTVLFVGRLSREKGVDLLVDAWATSPPTGLELVVVGDGPLKGELERRGVQGVRLVGHRSPADVRRLMLEARAVAIPSQVYEGQCLVVLEGMGAGLPTFVTSHGALPESVGREPALLVPPGDVATWRLALGRLGDDGLVDRIGAEARRRYLARYTPEVALRSLLDCYERVLDTGG